VRADGLGTTAVTWGFAWWQRAQQPTHKWLDLYRGVPISKAVSIAREGTLWRCSMIAQLAIRSDSSAHADERWR